ncbi:ABC transporter ATP-binding protein [Vandammella animalimorsus]|uniref:ABC transporter ATP-binding protein n=2 Tax=Vandammella animalimorsus TaxID=2029117 RepID=A0A2A2AT65_9BURK|nr:ABC transporter ATP-binding protein [Vandammella animalimorsus]PAT40884.1 ABC transporter ATP-binding protein [Vandammella animalimorsus]
MAAGLLLACATALMGALLLGVSGWFITGTALAGLSAATALAFDVFVPSASIRFLALGRTGARYAERLVGHAATLDALVALRERLLRSFAQPPAQAPQLAAAQRAWQLQPARLLLRLTRDLDAAEALYLRLALPCAAALATTLAISLWLAWQHLWLGLACWLWFWGWGLGITLWLARSSSALALAQSRHGERMRQQALELVGGQAELTMAVQFDAALQRWRQRQAELAALELRLQQRDAAAAAAWQALQALTLAAALAVAAWLVLARDMHVALAAFFVLMAMAGMEPFAALRRGTLEWAACLLAARRLQAPLARSLTPATNTNTAAANTAANAANADAPHAPSAALPAPEAGLAAQLQQVWLDSGRSGLARLQDCSLTLAEGEVLALVGASGSGKSSLLALLAGELAATRGTVRALPSLGLPQQTALFSDTVRANLNLQQRPLDDAALWAALELVGLKEAIAARPAGLDERLGEGGLGLSKGQGRRLALARLLLARIPQPGADATDAADAADAAGALWLLDEPTDGLDAATAQALLQRLAPALRGRSVVLATHMRREAALAGRLLLLEHGRITAQAVRGSAEFQALLARLRDG